MASYVWLYSQQHTQVMNSHKQYVESSFLMYTMNYIILIKIHICILITSFIAGLMANCQLLLPWCMVIAGYQISSDNTHSQRKPTEIVRVAGVLYMLWIIVVFFLMLNRLQKCTCCNFSSRFISTNMHMYIAMQLQLIHIYHTSLLLCLLIMA